MLRKSRTMPARAKRNSGEGCKLKRLVRAAGSACLLACATPSVAAAERSIGYDFFTVLVPDEVPASEQTIEKDGIWFTGKAFPRRVVRTNDSVSIAEQGITLPAGTYLGLAESGKMIGCSFDLAIKFRMGRSRVCLIDMDSDGRFDHWFRRGGGMIFYPYSSKISLDDILPAGTVAFTEVTDWRSVPGAHHFQARFWWKELRACTGDPEYTLTMECTKKGAQIFTDGSEHQVSFLRGVFKYRYVDKRFVIQTVKMPETTVGVEAEPPGKGW